MPIKPPIKTPKKSGQYIKNSFNISSLVNWPKIPDIELTKINKDAVVIIFFGLSASAYVGFSQLILNIYNLVKNLC